MNEEHSKPFTPVLPSLLLPMTASSPCFLSNLQPRTHTHTETHTATHKCTHLNTKPVAHTKQVFILLDVSMLSMFLHLCVCVYIGVCMCAWTLVFPLSSGLPTTNIAPSLFPSFSLPLFCCTNPPPPHPSHYGPWKTSTTFPPDPNAHLTKMLHPHMWL